MRKTLLIGLLFIVTVLLVSCSTEEWEEIQHTNIEGIETIVIDYRSTNVFIQPTDDDELKTALLLYDNGPSFSLKKGNGKINIRTKSNITRLFSIQKPSLTIRIPKNYTGEVVLKGSSGNVTGEDVQMEKLNISGSSGNVDLMFDEFMTQTTVSLSSGNVAITVREQPDASINFKSKSGNQSIDFVLDEQKQTKQSTTGTIGKGTYPLQIETTSGNVRLE